MTKFIYALIAVFVLSSIFSGCASKPAPAVVKKKDNVMYQRYLADEADKGLDRELNK